MESRLDQVYRSLLLTKFFTRGWGHPDHLRQIFLLRKRLSKRETARQCYQTDHNVVIDSEKAYPDHIQLEGHFTSPFVDHLPNVCPKECETATFQAVLPKIWPGRLKPLVIQFAGTGDHFFWRRRNLMAKPMVKERGIGSIIIENPFYGTRKPKEQWRSSLHHVSDLFIMGASLILESQLLLKWAEQEGYGPFVSHGISMGGHMASLAASAWPKPIGLVPCLSWTSASVTFCQGVMARAINWRQLSEQYDQVEDRVRRELWGLVHSPEHNAWRAGFDLCRQHLNGVKNNADHSTSTKEIILPQTELNSRDSISKEAGEKMLENIMSKYDHLYKNVYTRNSDGTRDTQIHPEALHFMRGVMDECTHLKNYDVPVDPELIYIVAAEHDAYQPRYGVMDLPQIWPGSKIRYIQGEGHIKSYLFHQHTFRQAIYDSLDALTEKYYTD